MAKYPAVTVCSTSTLKLYDYIVLTLFNTLAWRCPTQSVLLPFFCEHAGKGLHLDVGVGTGFYTAAAVQSGHLACTEEITLLDLNRSSLHVAQERLFDVGYKGRVQTMIHDVILPLPTSMHKTFGSVSMFHVLHGLPGSFPSKSTQAFRALIPAMTDNGVLYGTTILGQGVHHNKLGRILMKQYNRRGIFANRHDSYEALKESLDECFEENEIQIVGVVVLFVARRPIRRVNRNSASLSSVPSQPSARVNSVSTL